MASIALARLCPSCSRPQTVSVTNHRRRQAVELVRMDQRSVPSSRLCADTRVGLWTITFEAVVAPNDGSGIAVVWPSSAGELTGLFSKPFRLYGCERP